MKILFVLKKNNIFFTFVAASFQGEISDMEILSKKILQSYIATHENNINFINFICEKGKKFELLNDILLFAEQQSIKNFLFLKEEDWHFFSNENEENCKNINNIYTS